jgi:hypothetical protein
MKKFNITKEKFAEQYDKSIDEILDICDWKTYIKGEEVCGIVYGILTKNDIDKPMDIELFHEKYIIKYNEKQSKNSETSLSTDEVIDVVYELLTDLFSV